MVFVKKLLPLSLVLYVLKTTVLVTSLGSYLAITFHVGCVDLWLGQRRSFCPVCKRDARTINIDMPASPSERTPLLSPSLTPTSSFLLSSSPATSSFRSSYDIPSSSTTMYLPHSRSHTSFQSGSYRGSLPIPVSRSSVDLRNAVSRRSYNSPRSVHSRYTHILSPGNASTSWVVGSSSSQREHSLNINDSRSCTVVENVDCEMSEFEE
ncbi:hypothetical protein F2Q68_00002219 [Brassica cretica]|uniref:RING-type domain-containing protein n=1 Tax=Brassica cretica TaxID=69181 RepID=A0A8S9JLS3_BRACR|nr:hypothetical protein F2Q68_00002219 [Brassica cretica]